MIIFFILATAYSWLRAGAMPISAGPLTNPTIIHTVVFGLHARSSCSDMRTLYDILRSCFFTIVACIYRAVHPNIPDPKLGFWPCLGITIKTTFCALMAPELVIYWALRQWFGARYLVKNINEAMEKKAGKLKRAQKWTQIHGQFAQMGGFACKGMYEKSDVLKSEDIKKLLNAGRIDAKDLQVSEKAIKDKSKGDFLSKAVVLFQTTWFVFECLTRLHQGLPLLEVEIITLAFATLNAFTYAFWWYKPLNVHYPIFIHVLPENNVSVPAFPATTTTLIPQHDTDTVAQDPKEPIADSKVAESESKKEGMAEEAESEGDDPSFWQETVGPLRGWVKSAAEEIKRAFREAPWWRLPLVVVALLIQPIALVVVVVCIPLQEIYEGDGIFYSNPCYTSKGSVGLDQDSNIILNAFDRSYDVARVIAAFVGMIFGGIHFIAWDSQFRTHTQLILWRASSISLVGEPALILLFSLFSIIQDYEKLPDWLHDLVMGLKVIFKFFSGVAGYLLYPAARLCIIVLAFLALRDLPPGSFTNISWTTFIPHV